MTENNQAQLSREALLAQVGERLREVRKFQQKSVEEVAATLKLGADQIRALEAGDWNRLPDEVYALGFLRQYARLMRVDISAEVAQLKSDMTLRQPWTIPDPAVSPSKRWAWLVLLLAVAGLVYANVWYQQDEPVIEPSETVANHTARHTSPIPEVVPPVKDIVDDPSEPIASDAATETTSMPEPSVEATAPAELSEPDTTPEPVVSEDTAESPGLTTHQLMLVATGGDVWLQVFEVSESGDERKLKETLLRDGQQLILQSPASQWSLTAGNAVALSITIDGKERYAAGSLGKDGRVLRHFSLPLEEATE